MIKMLCTGDLHLGRLPSALPTQVDASSVSPASVWSDVVDVALREQVDMVLLSGDLIDRSNRLFEAFGPLESGIRSLIEEGIVVIAVAGNHDFDALPRFNRTFRSLERPSEGKQVQSGFHLLGEGGEWERLTVVKDGKPLAHVDGWSFPTQHVSNNPLHQSGFRDLLVEHDSSIPTIGLLHADLGQRESRYAPVQAADLKQSGHHFWLLGHIHQPTYDDGTNTCKILYPGSAQPLDPGETGVRGPWLVRMSRHGSFGSSVFDVEATQIPMARLMYENVTVDVTGAQTVSDAERDLIAAVRQRLTYAADQCGTALRHLLIRLHLTGRTSAHRHLDEALRQVIHDLELTEGSTVAHLTKLTLSTVPDRDLKTISEGQGAPALLARTLLSIEDGTSTALVKEVRQKVTDVQKNRAYVQLGHEKQIVTSQNISDADDDRIVEWIRQEGLRLLDALLAQKEANGSGGDHS